LHYLVSTVPLTFAKPVVRLAIIHSQEDTDILNKTKKAMGQKILGE